MREYFIKKLISLAEEDERIFLIVGDLGFKIFDNFIKKFPKRYLNVGIAEQNMIGIATGLALEGKIIFVYSIANFPTIRCLEQIRNDVCFHKLNVNIISVGGGMGYGALGFSHHTTEDLAIMRVIPNIEIIVPADNWECYEATAALAKSEMPGYLRIDKKGAEVTNSPDEIFQIGKARRIREGNDISIFCIGGILAEALSAAEELSKIGIECRVISNHSLNPLDLKEVEAAVKETNGIITVEEHSIYGGLGGAISEYCLENKKIPKNFYRIGLRDGFTSIVGDQDYLRQKYHINENAIIKKVKEIMSL